MQNKFDYQSGVERHRRVSRKHRKVHKEFMRQNARKVRTWCEFDKEFFWRSLGATVSLNLNADELHWQDTEINWRCHKITGQRPE